MTRSAIDAAAAAPVGPGSVEDHRLARYAALAIALSVLENALPSPLPGVKPGLANLVVLLVLWRHGWAAAAWVSLLRILGTALVLGGLFTPGFALSLAGGLASLTALAVAGCLPRRWFGPVTLSLAAALAHMAGQLLLARAWLIPHDALLRLAPVLAAAALLFGLVNGVLAARLLSEHAP
ncbi:Gx transporter family protein [Chitiniphilus purpureus]|uniref:Gx transporter family protein n=1 Tax=Chitiniphilus purpureus TaxID=2981137 RepID=A0ABY6DLR6_9NEIS|nr:Gx transporter family protein [Chitiniphilus sp. CD1]UXY15282.1 Gx transporter family protein [Chitiniphilus sp. CD1]